MAQRLNYTDDVKGNIQEVQGSDGRLNVSSRADGRGYYNSRDKSESYTLTFNDAGATIADWVVYLKNDKTDGKHLVIRSASINGEVLSSFELHTVTGTAADGASATPLNLNQAGVARSATATAMTVADSETTPIAGLTSAAKIDQLQVVAGGHGEFLLNDQLRIGQDQAIAIKMSAGAANKICSGVIFFYFE